MRITIEVKDDVTFGELMPADDLLAIGRKLAAQVKARAKGGIGSNGQPLTTPLRRTGRMLNTVHARPDGDGVVIVSDAPYAGAVDAHHPWLGVAPQDEATLDEAIDLAIMAALEGD